MIARRGDACHGFGGPLRRLAALGWTAQTALDDGLAQTDAWLLDHQYELRKGP